MMKRIALLVVPMLVMVFPGESFGAKTRLEDVWQDKAQHIVVRKIAVFWLARSSENRIVAEGEFVRQLKERGLIAMPAYVVIPPDRFVARDEVMRKLRDLGVDTVVTLRPVNKLTGKANFPTTGPPGPSDLSGYYQFVYDEPAADTSGAVYVETVLFDAMSGIRVWAARSVTKVDVVDPGVLQDFVETMISRLVSDKMLQ